MGEEKSLRIDRVRDINRDACPWTINPLVPTLDWTQKYATDLQLKGGSRNQSGAGAEGSEGALTASLCLVRRDL